MASDSWFKSFADVVENLPMTVLLTLPDAAADFTLIYANRLSEYFTGSSRVDMLGLSCPFFSSEDLFETSCVSRLRSNLSAAIPCRASLTIKRKNGSRFSGTILNKPMFDTLGKHRFTVSVLCDGCDDNTVRSMGDFLCLVPNIISV